MNEFIMNVGKFLTNHRRAIFTGGSILSLGVTVATAIAETKKAEVAVKEMREKKEKPEAKDYAKVYAKSYWKTAALFVFTIVVVSCNCYLDTKEITGLASACVISEKKLVNFKKSANEIVGKEQTKEISKSAEKRNKATNVSEDSNLPVRSTILNIGNGSTLFFDEYSGRYFYSDYAEVLDTIYSAKYEYSTMGEGSLGEFYEQLGLPHATGFDSLYFRSDEIYLEACMSDTKKPCYMIRFGHTPSDMSV